MTKNDDGRKREEAHAFEEPFSILKSLRNDVTQLRIALKDEQRKRSLDVEELRTEIEGLKLQKQKENLLEAVVEISQELTTLKSEKLQALDKMKVGFTRSLQQLQQQINDEVRDRQAGEAVRDTRQAADRSERITECDTIKEEATKREQSFNTTRDEMLIALSDIKHDVDLISSVMAKFSCPTSSLTRENLESYQYIKGQHSLQD